MDPAQRETWDAAETGGPTRPGTDTGISLGLKKFDVDPKTGELTATLRVHNSTQEDATDLAVNVWRAQKVLSPADARLQLASNDFTFYGGETQMGDLGSGESADITVTVPPDSGLGFGDAAAAQRSEKATDPAVFPLEYTLTGVTAGDTNGDAGAEEVLASERTLAELPGHPAEDDEPGADPDADAEEPAELTVLYPLHAKLDILPGETGEQELILATDSLAEELAPGGRLDRLVDTYLSHDLHGAGCVALDPALVNTVARMADGYRVAPTRPKDVAKPKRLRDSWFQHSSRHRGKEGTGAADAKAWLHKLDDVDCTVPLPWANTDPSAVSQVGNDWLTYEALDRGADTIERITGKRPVSDLIIPGSGYVTEPMPRPALVAANSTWHGDAVTFDPSLGALLAQAGPLPQTPGYSRPDLRADYTRDSEYARALNSAAALSLAVGEGDVVIAKLASVLDPAAAEQTLDAAERALQAGARPMPVTELGTVPGAADEKTGVPAGSAFLAPAQFSVPEIQQVQQQAHYTDDLMRIMVDVPHIAMTRYGYTLTLRRGLLQALSVTERENYQSHLKAVRRFRRHMDEHAGVLRDLRSSVTLIPPGNVYTRVSDSSPLLIVAENGLPLPVDARILYATANNARLNTPETVYIPARGSITVAMTANMPAETDRTRLKLWLATPDEEAISEPIDITVQTRAGIVRVYGVGLVAALVVILALIFRVGRKKKFGRHR